MPNSQQGWGECSGQYRTRYCDTRLLIKLFLIRAGSLWPVFESLQCHYSDEVVLYGGMTGVCWHSDHHDNRKSLCVCVVPASWLHTTHTHTHTHTLHTSIPKTHQAPVPVFTCKFTPDGLHGHLLAAGDEEGSVRLMDTRRPGSQSLIKG